jgi:radical SAM superfamily enzyme YgiQ (UPF0313 family)
MDVLLVQPRIGHAKRGRASPQAFVPPMMLFCLAKPLVERRFKVDILDLTVSKITLRGFKNYIRRHQPRIVGITSSTLSYTNAIRAAKAVKEIDPEITVVMGGPHVTFRARDALDSGYVDFVVRGEGDVCFPQLVELLLRGKGSLSKIGGISYLENGDLVENPRVFVRDLDKLGYPQRDGIERTRYAVLGTVQTSRGCPFACKFCAAAAMGGGKYRLRSVESITSEIDYLVGGLGLDSLAFSDDTVTGFPEMTMKICRHILRRGYKVQWVCESRVDVADRSLLELMARAGCMSIQFGFESGSDLILESIRKKISPPQMMTAVRLCKKFGINPAGNFMIGFPEETRKTIKKTVSVAKRLKKLGATVGLAMLTPFPGTYFFEHADDVGIKIHSYDWDEYDLENTIISTRNLDIDELRTIHYDTKIELQSS